MKVLKTGVVLFILSLFVARLSAGAETGKGKKNILVLNYHHITSGSVKNPDTNTQKTLAQQIEFFRTHGFHFVSVQDLVDAAKGKKKLPQKPVLLTFDDAYVSFYNFVFPLLKELKCPAMVAVVGSWIDHPPKEYLVAPLMTWKEIREVAESGLVEVASHSYNLHHSVQYTPQGNVTAAVAALRYLPKLKRYETLDEYKKRIKKDFGKQKALFLKKLGMIPRIMVWPYGRFNDVALKIAKQTGILFTFSTEEGLNTLNDLQRCGKRFYIEANLAHMDRFISFITQKDQPDQLRVAQIDLDLIYDPHSVEQTDKNLGLLIDRLVDMGVSTVFLQAFADPDGDGIVKSVYFPNHILPVRADIFGHACHQIMIRGIQVFAWMPTLGIELPEKGYSDDVFIHRLVNEKIHVDRRRLSPFSPNTAKILRSLYEDLAAHSLISGVLFQDDATLSDTEGNNPAALRKFWGQTQPKASEHKFPASDNPRWIIFKTKAIDTLLSSLGKCVRIYRPFAKFARNIFAEAVLNPKSQEWFAQSYPLMLKQNDFVVIMAYPKMEKVRKPGNWLKDLVSVVKRYPDGIRKTVFKLQTYDWQKEQWIDSDTILKWMRELEALGAWHLAYYPDNVFKNEPNLGKVRLEMSTKDFSMAEYKKFLKENKGGQL